MNSDTLQEIAEIQLANNEEQIRFCYQVMRQLRPHLVDEQKFVEQVRRQIQEGYHLAYLLVKSEVKALAGFRFLEFLAWGKVSASTFSLPSN